MDVVFNLLHRHPRASTVLARTAARLGFENIIWGQVPGPVNDELEQPLLSDAFAKWRVEATIRKRLQNSIASFRASPRSPATPEITGESTWAERDVKLRAEAVSLPSTPIAPTPITPRHLPPAPLPSKLPFQTVADLPTDLQTSKHRAAIVHIITSRVDRTKQRWRCRSLYTAENWAEWARWQASEQPHRDANNVHGALLKADEILTAPNLRSPDVETAADAWNNYRRHLLNRLRQALIVGIPWPEILVNLSITYSDTENGYPRLVGYINAALEATVLLNYPLLHADLLMHELDESYATGSRKYSYDSVVVDWERAVSRLPGEDPITLALRVIHAFVTKTNNPDIDVISVWEHSSLAHEINTRYAACLTNDIADPARGEHTASIFTKAWYQARAQHQLEGDSFPASRLSCERLARVEVVPQENANANSLAHEEEHAAPCEHRSHQTGAGSRARRDAARAATRDGLPPSAYMNDTIPE